MNVFLSEKKTWAFIYGCLFKHLLTELLLYILTLINSVQMYINSKNLPVDSIFKPGFMFHTNMFVIHISYFIEK